METLRETNDQSENFETRSEPFAPDLGSELASAMANVLEHSSELETSAEKTLTPEQARQVYQAVMEEFDPAKTAWTNPPELVNGEFFHDGQKVSAEAALEIMQKKLNGAYTERLLGFLNGLERIVANGYKVELVQFQKEVGVPFDANGWTVVVLETMPIYHLAPWDLDASKIADLVNIYQNNQDERVSWKQTNKRGESLALNAALTMPGQDLVKIAREGSEAK